jgi:L-lactate dehydrogenase (cytochrome)
MRVSLQNQCIGNDFVSAIGAEYGEILWLSTMGVCDVHEVAQKTGVPPWFQLYMLKDRGFVQFEAVG